MSRASAGLRRRLARALAAAALVIAMAPAAATAASLSVSLPAPGHTLEIGKTWIAHATVTHNGQPVSGQVRYQMLAVTKVEATEPWTPSQDGSAREEFKTRYGTAAAGGGFTAKLTAPNHTPIAGSSWYIAVTATKGSVKLNGDVNYEFLSGGQVVSHQKGHTFKDGILKDSLCFPALAVGQPLTLGVVVTTRYGSRTLLWTVTTKTGRVTSPCKSSP